MGCRNSLFSKETALVYYIFGFWLLIRVFVAFRIGYAHGKENGNWKLFHDVILGECVACALGYAAFKNLHPNLTFLEWWRAVKVDEPLEEICLALCVGFNWILSGVLPIGAIYQMERAEIQDRADCVVWMIGSPFGGALLVFPYLFDFLKGAEARKKLIGYKPQK
jgi:uncharacterized membrane protein HdeD (DUF308 family)